MKPSTSDDESTWEPLNAKSTSEIAKPPACDFLCQLAEMDMEKIA